MTEDRRGLGTAWATAKEIRARILAQTGLTASAGVSYNKFLAKLASDHRKPNGQFAVTPEMGAAWVETLPVSRFHGVGPVTAAKMQRLGIETGADLRAKSLDFLQRHFGSSAEWYHQIVRGVDERPVNPNRERKSSGSETTFSRDLTEDAEIEAAVLGQADDVWEWCERTQGFGRTATVKIKYADFQIITRSRSHTAPITSREQLHAASIALLRSVLPTPKGIRLVGVTVSNFERGLAEPLPLFGHADAP
ncbi:DNA polymerase IV [Sphingomonas sp. S2M10]|nr:DNA polymerase IV [Sphingomonas sp. S2M10]